jgi:hypothetical protein
MQPHTKDILILLKRKYPTQYEIHRGEILQNRNLILTTTDLQFAEKLVKSYNSTMDKESQLNKV